MRLTSKYLSLSESLQSTLSPERSSSSNFLSSTCAVNHLSVNQTEDANITELYQPCSGTSLKLEITLMQLLSNIFLCGALCYCGWVLNNPPHKPIKIERCEFALHLCIWRMLFLTLHSRFIWSAHVFIERLKCLCKNKCTSFSFFLWFHWSREQTAEERQLWNRCLSASRVAL